MMIKEKSKTKVHPFELMRRGLRREKPRAILFVDHANIFHNIQKLRARIDYRIFKDKYLSKGKLLMHAFMYRGEMKESFSKNRQFNDYIRSLGFVIFTRPVVISQSGRKKQNGIDSKIVMDIKELAEYNAFDCAVLVSGDGIFSCLVDFLKKLEKKLIIWSFRRSLSYQLIKKVNKRDIHYIDAILNKINYKNLQSKKEKD